MTPEEIEQKARTVANMLGHEHEDAVRDVSEAMTALVREAKREAYEEAARVAQDRSIYSESQGWYDGRDRAAKDIRSLIDSLEEGK